MASSTSQLKNLPEHLGQSLMNKKDMQEALQRLRSLATLESRAISSETRVDVAECRQIAEQLRLESSAMRLGMSFTIRYRGMRCH